MFHIIYEISSDGTFSGQVVPDKKAAARAQRLGDASRYAGSDGPRTETGFTTRKEAERRLAVLAEQYKKAF